MAVTETWDTYPPGSLLAAGLRQGTLFRLPGAMYVWNEVEDPSRPQTTTVQSRKIKEKEFLILISQDCDILSRDEPRVEALLVRVKDKASDQGYLARIAENSSREFVLDPKRGLVADARVRVQIAKEVLQGISPEPWTMDDRTSEEFVDWLAGRYDRPPVPTAVFEAVCRPIRNEIERLKANAPDEFAALNRSIKWIRIRLPSAGSPELDVGLLFVLEDDIDEEGAIIVEATIEDIKQLVAQGAVPCNLELELVPYGELLHSEFAKTRLLDVNYMTDQGNEVSLATLNVFAD